MSLTATQRMKLGVMSLAGNECCSHSKTKTSNFRIFYILPLNWFNWLLTITKTQKIHVQSFRITFRKRAFRYWHPKRFDRKFWNYVFRNILTKKNVALKMLFFGLFSLVPATLYLDPKNTVSGIRWYERGSLDLRGISPTLNITATNLENFMLPFFVKYPKNVN